MFVFVPVLVALMAISANCHANDNAAVLDQIEGLISENTLENVHNDDNKDVAAAVRYMIPVPIKVIVPVPQPVQPTYPDEEVEPIVAVPIGARPGRYGPRWGPVGPPFLAVPAGSQQPYYPPPARYGTYGSRTYPQSYRAAAAIRRTRSVDEEDLKAEEDQQEELTSELSNDASVQGLRGLGNPLKASSKKSGKGYKSSGKRYRSKRQVGGYYVRPGYQGGYQGGYQAGYQAGFQGGYGRPARVFVPTQQVVVPAPSNQYVPNTQYVPVPVYVPVHVEPAV